MRFLMNLTALKSKIGSAESEISALVNTAYFYAKQIKHVVHDNKSRPI